MSKTPASCVASAASAALVTGRSSTRAISDVPLGTGGAYLGHELSDGNPAVTVAGAAGGVLLSEGLH